MHIVSRPTSSQELLGQVNFVCGILERENKICKFGTVDASREQMRLYDFEVT